MFQLLADPERERGIEDACADASEPGSWCKRRALHAHTKTPNAANAHTISGPVGQSSVTDTAMPTT